ncbi:MAG: hypothetical protein ACTS3F_11380 [Phycisphaerales bacterium]
MSHISAAIVRKEIAMKGKERGHKRGGETMRQILAGVVDRNADQLMEKALRASQLAKVLRGPQASQVYAVKARCLRQLVKHGGDAVQLGVDQRCGLLSVRLDNRRLHTHESWLYPNEPWWRKTE